MRYYDPSLGRWLTPDPAGNIDGPNLYAYVHNNPLIYFDQYGLFSEQTSFSYFGYHGLYDDSDSLPVYDYNMVNHFSDAFGSLKNGISHIFSNPHFQGSMQAIGGLGEAGLGASMSLLTSGCVAPVGFPIMAHGLDHFFTGMNTAITGMPKATVTSQLLQHTGMSSQTAGLMDTGLSLVGSVGAAGVIRANQTAAFPIFNLPPIQIRTIDPQIIRFSQNSISNNFRSGGNIDELCNFLKKGLIKAHQVQPIRLVKRNNLLFTLDNRRLEAFRRVNIHIPYRMATAEEISAEAWKFTSINEGISIKIRGN